MIGEKGEPALARVTSASEPSQVSGDRAFRNCEAEFEQFTMDLRCAPPEFSAAIVRTKVRSSGLTFGRPECRERQRQYRWKPALCQPTTLSGFTITRTSDHRGHTFRNPVQKKRSRRVSLGRGRLRLRTATCWRKARTSTAVSIRLRKKTHPATTSANIKSNMKPPL